MPEPYDMIYNFVNHVWMNTFLGYYIAENSSCITVFDNQDRWMVGRFTAISITPDEVIEVAIVCCDCRNTCISVCNRLLFMYISPSNRTYAIPAPLAIWIVSRLMLLHFFR